MPGPYGVTSTGFVPKPFADIVSDIETAERGAFGAGIPTGPNTIWGQLNNILGERFADLWQQAAAIYNAAFVESATEAQLDQVVALAGIARLPATFSAVPATVTFTGGIPSVGTIILPSGSKASVIGTGAKFQTTADLLSDGSSSSYDILFTSLVSGPVEAPAGTLSVIETPVTNWATVMNALDQDPLGTNIETDSALRLRFANSLRAQGDGAAAAIRARLLEVLNVTTAFVYENISGATDSNGLPPHTIECVVDGGDDLTVAQLIYNSKPAGIGTYGTSVRHDVAGADGLAKSIFYSRPDEEDIYLAVTIKTDPALYPSNGDALINVAIGNVTFVPGQTVRAGSGAFLTAITSVPGVLEITGLPFIGLAPSPGSSADLVFTNHQKAKMDSSRVTVTHA